MPPLRTPEVLVLPGLGSSGPGHWQTLWEGRHGYRRVQQRDWERPRRADWIAAIDRAVRAAHAPVVLAAHSLACAAVAHWAAAGDDVPDAEVRADHERRGRPDRPDASFARVSGALLVAPADVDSPARTPPETRSFAPLPLAPLPFPAIVVASENDPYVTLDRATLMARRWGAELVNVGAAGHINADSGLGDWAQGRRLLQRLLERAAEPP